MHIIYFSQSSIIPLIVILISARFEAAKKIFGCKGKLFKRNTTLNFRELNRINFNHNLSHIVIPKRFDSRDKWPFCKSLRHIKDQGECGGCWAFASASVMADRLCIATRGDYDKSLSEQDLMECCHSCVPNDKAYTGGCEGGFIEDAFEYWKQHGMVTGDRGCKPTEKSSKNLIFQEECRLRCTNKKYTIEYEKDKTFAAQIFQEDTAVDPDIKYIMAEIMLNGPVVGGMLTYDYIGYSPPNGILIYNKNLIETDEEPEDHAVKIIGWDNINGTSVWIIANSWGTDWCMKGFCYVKRGDFGIENHEIVTGTPKDVNNQGTTDSKKNTAQASCILILTLLKYLIPLK